MVSAHARATWGCGSATLARHQDTQSVNPLVGECNDAFLNDIRGRHVSVEHVLQAIKQCSSGPVPEGAVGAGVGMSCYGYKGGIGSASRAIADSEVAFVVGALVLANFGRLEELTLDGVRVGELLAGHQPSADVPTGGGSVMVIVGTDAPLDARQLGRMARRAVLGLARTGSIAHHGSGDFVLAFSSTNRVPHRPPGPFLESRALLADAHPLMDRLFLGTVESVEEAVVNALFRAETMHGRAGHVREAVPIELVVDLLRRASRIYDQVE
jgi:D-aminopeptidase